MIETYSFLNVDEHGIGQLVEMYPNDEDHVCAILPMNSTGSEVRTDDLLGSYKISPTEHSRSGSIQCYKVKQQEITVDFYLMPDTTLSPRDTDFILESVAPLLKAIGKNLD